jgi:hypothetical protein
VACRAQTPGRATSWRKTKKKTLRTVDAETLARVAGGYVAASCATPDPAWETTFPVGFEYGPDIVCKATGPGMYDWGATSAEQRAKYKVY